MEALSDDEELDFHLDCDLDEDSSSRSSDDSVSDSSDEETCLGRSRSTISKKDDENGRDHRPADSIALGGNVQWLETFIEQSIANFNQNGKYRVVLK